MRRRSLRAIPMALALTLTVALVTACSGENPFGTVIDDGGDELTVTVDLSDTAVYGWSGANGSSLQVLRVGDATVVWRLDRAAGSDGFAPPVSHGVVPAGTTEQVDAQTLQLGVEYRVEVTLTDGQSGQTTFTP